jgi:hypothetical protein
MQLKPESGRDRDSFLCRVLSRHFRATGRLASCILKTVFSRTVGEAEIGSCDAVIEGSRASYEALRGLSFTCSDTLQRGSEDSFHSAKLPPSIFNRS